MARNVLWNFQRWEFLNQVHFGLGRPGILGTTWEPDECLPPHLDDIRLREKRAWIKRRKDAGAQVALEAGKVGRWKHKSELERGNLLRNQTRWMHLVLAESF